MIGAIIGAGVSALGQGVNAWIGAREAARQRALLNSQEREEQAWYDRRYNEAGRERADAQWALTRLAEAQRERMNNAAGRQAVIGSSSAIKAAEQRGATTAAANAMAQIDAAQEARRDKIDAQHQANKQSITNARMKNSAQVSQNTANAATAATMAGAQIAAAGLGGGRNPFASVWDDNEFNPTQGELEQLRASLARTRKLAKP